MYLKYGSLEVLEILKEIQDEVCKLNDRKSERVKTNLGVFLEKAKFK